MSAAAASSDDDDDDYPVRKLGRLLDVYLKILGKWSLAAPPALRDSIDEALGGVFSHLVKHRRMEGYINELYTLHAQLLDKQRWYVSSYIEMYLPMAIQPVFEALQWIGWCEQHAPTHALIQDIGTLVFVFGLQSHIDWDSSRRFREDAQSFKDAKALLRHRFLHLLRDHTRGLVNDEFNAVIGVPGVSSLVAEYLSMDLVVPAYADQTGIPLKDASRMFAQLPIP
jgi:hypothetical protein